MSRIKHYWDSFNSQKFVQQVKKFVRSEQGRQWLSRLIAPGLAIVLLVVLNHFYSAWTGLTTENPIRRAAAVAGFGALVFGISILWRTRVQLVYLTVVSLFLGALMVANAVYTGYAGGFLSASTLSYFWYASDTAGSILALLDPYMALFLLPGILLLLAAIFARRLPVAWPALGRKTGALVVAGLVIVAAAGYGYAALKEMQLSGSINRVTKQPFDAKELVRAFGITNYSLIDSFKYVWRKRTLTPDEEAFVKKHRDEQVQTSGPNQATGWLAGRNIIFLQLESFQQLLVGLKVKDQEVTPNLNRLAAGGRQYTSFNYTIGPGTSSDGEFATFNSLLPLANQAVVFDYPANDYPAFPAKLKSQGYATEAFHADSASFWNRSSTFPVFGFDKYVAEEEYGDGELLGFGLNDRDFMKQTVDKIAKLKQPFYAHAITLSSHTPYVLPEKHQTLDLDGLGLKPLQQDYLQAAHYVDGAIGDFMTALEQKGLMEKSAIVVMGDHEGFVFQPDDSDYAKFLGYPDEDGFSAVNNLAARTIPFIIYAPGTPLTGTDAKPASQIDIAPTLLNLMGIKKPDTALGVDLFGEQTPTVVRRSRGTGPSLETAIQGDLIYTVWTRNGKPACYRAGQPADIEKECGKLRDFAVQRAILSDNVIMGNRVDLLRP
jgi:phosphoglycerol transferase MdoB-like AlkP superfamily enzyme